MKKALMYALLFCSILLTSCNSIKTAIFDQYSYQQEVSLKIETKILLQHATESYTPYKVSSRQFIEGDGKKWKSMKKTNLIMLSVIKCGY